MNQFIGKRLGAYQLLEQVGQGGMATIFKAYQASMDRYVAIKILPSHFTEDETFVARFTQEARTLARLEHPHILPVHDYGEHEGITYLVMRYIKAGTLKDLIAQQGAMNLNEVARILGQVGRALDYAHSQGVVHRDIKPTNVLIDQRGDAFLTDFGIAKIVAGTAQFTATGAIIGTPAYMSPEQGLGESADYRSDIYSLGVVLYEMVTGRVPFEAETPLAVLLKHVNAPLPPPRQLQSDLPEAVERVILKAMAKSPDDRYQNAQEMIVALQKAVAGIPTEVSMPKPSAAAIQSTIPAQTVSVPQRPAPGSAPPRPAVAPPPRKSLPWLPIVGGVALLAVILVALVFILPNLGGGESEATPTREKAVARATTVAPATAEPIATITPSSTVVQPSATPTPIPVTPEPPTPERVAYPPGWTSYSNANSVLTLARQGEYLWVGGEGGLVRWNVNDRSYTKFGVPDGLASSRINDLLVDQDGNLWAATDAGINRFDGRSWLTFNMYDGLDADWVQSLFLDSTGSLWAGTAYGERGLNYYDGVGWGPPPIPPLPIEYPSVKTFIEDEDGLLVGLEMNGLAYFDGEMWEMLTTADGLPSDFVQDVLLTDDALWVSFDYSVVRFGFDTGEPEVISPLEYVGIYAMHYASDGSLWFGGEGGAVRYDPYVGDWQWFESGTGPIPSWAVTDIVEDERGLWLGTHDGGVMFYDGLSWESWVTNDKVGANDTAAIIQDGSGALWFAHNGGGLSRYNPDDDAWQTFGEGEGALDWPSYPGVDADGHIWIGGYGELKSFDGRYWQTTAPAQLADLAIYYIGFGPDNVQWLVTDDGLVRHDPETNEWMTFTSEDHPLLEDPNTVHIHSDGVIWVGGYDGLIRYDGNVWSAPDAVGDPPGWVDGIAEAPDGSLWVTADGALYHLDGGRWIQFSWPGDDWIERISIGPDGSVWVGYDGLGRYDPSSGAWQMYTTDDGLVHPLVQAIYVTPDGVVWVGTEGGISRFVPER